MSRGVLVIMALVTGMAARLESAPPRLPACVGSEYCLAHDVQVSADGLVSVDVHDVTLESVLRALAAHFQLDVSLDPLVGERITVVLREHSLSESLARLLRRHSYVLELEAPRQSGARGRLLVLGDETSLSSAAIRYESRVSFDSDVDPWGSIEIVDAALDAGDGPPGLVELSALLEHPGIAVREEAVFALGRSPGPAALTALESALTDPAPSVRQAAVIALAERGGARSLAALLRALGDPAPAVREEAVGVLAALSVPSARLALQAAATDRDDGVRRAALEALETPE